MPLVEHSTTTRVEPVIVSSKLHKVKILQETVITFQAFNETTDLTKTIVDLSLENQLLKQQLIRERNAALNDDLKTDIMESDQQNQTDNLNSQNDIENDQSNQVENIQETENPTTEPAEECEIEASTEIVSLEIPKINIPEDESDESAMGDLKRDSVSGSKNLKLDLSTVTDLENLSLRSLSEGDNSVFSDGSEKKDSDNESEEVDDIELIFTTEDTIKGDVGLQEDLVSIGDMQLDDIKPDEVDNTGVNQENQEEGVDTDTPCTAIFKSNLPTTVSQQKSVESYTDSSAYFGSVSFDNKSIDKDESFDQLDKRLQSIWSKYSLLIETDISKCGVADENAFSIQANRRNTCPNPLGYFRGGPPPSMQSRSDKRGAIIANKYNVRSTKIRPILNNQLDAKPNVKTEAEAQTEITALPWKSESYLAHRIATNFTTLPSKFTIPTTEHSSFHPQKIKLSDKTQEARRVLLSDINFTSMVPELSRSADHLFQQADAMQAIENMALHTCTKGAFLRTPDFFRNNTIDVPDGPISPIYGKFCIPRDYSNYGSSWLDHRHNRNSAMSMNSPSMSVQCEFYQPSSGPATSNSRSSSWKYNCPLSFESTTSYKGLGTANGQGQRPVYASVPTSPTRQNRSRSVPHVQRSFVEGYPSRMGCTGSKYNFSKFLSRPTSQWGFGQKNKTRSRVTFEDSSYKLHSRTNTSLPDLRSDSWETEGDSTDSLVEEAEHYLRRSIDCVTNCDKCSATGPWKQERTYRRRSSAPNPIRETDPPIGSIPYLPRTWRDLRLGHWVKVIGREGRVRGGRVKHVGPIMASVGQGDNYFVGVELPTSTGNSDGTYQGRQYFQCEKDHAIFVPFNKVIMAWST